MSATATVSAEEIQRLKNLRVVGTTGPANRYRYLSSRILYVIGWLMSRWIWFCTFSPRILRRETIDRPGGYQIACSHVSHLEPFLLCVINWRMVDWATRIEFYQRRWSTWLLSRLGAFPMHRQGRPVSAIRTAIDRINAGRVIGICPEGGVKIGNDSVCRGGPIKLGTCLISYRTNTPIIPVVMVGTHQLQRVGPWLPFRRTKLWIAFGKPVFPDSSNQNKRAERGRIATELQQQFVALYDELREKFSHEGCHIPDSVK